MIGRDLAGLLREDYELTLTDRTLVETDLPFVPADLASLDEMKRVTEGVDAIVHLGAASWEYDYETVMVPANLIGVRQIYQAALENGVRRVLFASTFHTIGLHFRLTDEPLPETVEIRPDTVYATTKVYGEGLGRWYAEVHGLSVVVLRIGYYQNAERVAEGLTPNKARLVLSPRDFAQMVRLTLEHPDLPFDIFHVTSQALRPAVSIEKARRVLGYEPEDTVASLFGEAAAAAVFESGDSSWI